MEFLEAQLKLKSASVLVVGAGGLGCPAIQYLSAAGIGPSKAATILLTTAIELLYI